MGYIKKSSIDKVYEALHIEEVIGDYVELKKSGANFKGKSPFTEERTGSFMVSPVKQIWKDFSSGKGGNAVNFLIENGMDYPEAIEHIAKKYNIQLEYERQEISQQKKEILDKKESLRKTLVTVHELYKSCFKSIPNSHPAKTEVFEKRLYDEDVILEWGIGFAPENFLHDKLASSGKTEDGNKLGLIVNQWDKYSNRVIYPIHDRNGLLIGFGGRDISGKQNTGKWINPTVDQNNILYEKAKVLYGLHKAKLQIRKRNECFMVEGYNDVIAAHRYDLENCVSASGTAISSFQINEIKKLCDKIVFWMDPDKAGMAAVLKYIPEFIKQGFRTEVLITDLDPDEYVRKYNDVIGLTGGLHEMFKTPGVRVDGFRILVNEFIKKDYIDLETRLAAETHTLQIEINSHTDAVEMLNDELLELEQKQLEGVNELTTIELEQETGKKSEEYKTKNIEVSKLKKNFTLKKLEIKSKGESDVLKTQRLLVQEIKNSFDTAFKNSELNRSAGAKKILETVIHVQDKAYYESYVNWVQKESGISKTALNNWIKELRNETETLIPFENDNDFDAEYILPKNVKINYDVLEPIIKAYGMFMANNQVYMALPVSPDNKVYFSSISNFEIEILQHMNDEKFPTKLIRIRNIRNQEIIFDTLSDNLNSPQVFYNTMSGFGNFNFKGNNSDLGTLRTYLFDNMGNGRKVEVLGIQPETESWVWNNNIVNLEGEDMVMDSNGVYVENNTHYYVPSANKIHRFSNNKYNSQKRFKVMHNPTSFEVYMAKVRQVHREHSISALLFGIASLFQDIAVDESGNFPILFFYGPGGSGKDELAYIVQSFTGVPQVPINLEGGASTLKAKIIELAQFRNGISQMSEYKRGDSKLDGIIKSIWDRVGYKRGSIESRIAMDTVDIESSVVLTGNDYPNAEPIIIRLIWNEMIQNKFSEQEMKNFDELNDMTEKGVSGYSNQLLKFRKQYKEQYSKSYRLWKGMLKEYFPEAKGRVVSNLAVLGATYQIMRDTAGVLFPFSQTEMIDHFRTQLNLQMAKIQSASIMVRFWDCFIASLRGHKDDRLQVGFIVSQEENVLFIQWTHTMDKIERKWWTQYHELPPSRATFKDELIKTGVLIEEKKVHSFDKGRNGNRSSAFAINLNRLSEEVKQDITGSIHYQMNEGSLWDKTYGKDGASETQTAIPLDDFKEDDDDSCAI